MAGARVAEASDAHVYVVDGRQLLHLRVADVAAVRPQKVQRHCGMRGRKSIEQQGLFGETRGRQYTSALERTSLSCSAKP